MANPPLEEDWVTTHLNPASANKAISSLLQAYKFAWTNSASWEQAVKDKEHELTQIEKTKETIQSDYGKLTSHNQELMKSIEEIELDRKSLKAKIQDLSENLGALEIEKQELEDASDRSIKLRTTLGELRQLNAEIEKELNDSKAHIKSLEEENKDLLHRKGQADVNKVILTSTRKIDRFRGRPISQKDPSVHEWIADVKGHLASRTPTPTIPEQASFMIDHLAGEARQEIMGRGDSVRNDPEEIAAVLKKVFGDGDTLPALEQQFFSYGQGSEDLITTSLKLVEIYNRMVEMNSGYKVCRQSSLKSRLAEAVKDESLRREIRRLNIESPTLTFFEMRDRATEWQGRTRSSASVKEVSTSKSIGQQQPWESKLEKLLTQQEELLKALKVSKGSFSGGGHKSQQGCYSCGSSQHWRQDCPNRNGRNNGSSFKKQPLN